MNYTNRTRSKRVAGEVRAEMGRKGHTAVTLSRATDIGYATLLRRLSGSHAFTLDELGVVAQALGVTVTELVSRAEGGEAA